MCGICGIYRYGAPEAETSDLSRVAAMTRVLGHRGPDDEGYFADGPVSLGHRRLSIIDPANGRQPMHSTDHRWILSYNGEIYNYVALRAELEKHGARFRTNADTEVVVEAFAAWGPDCVTRFNGEFGIAAYDVEKRILHLVRDRVGIRNVYYAETKGCVVFASEAKALFASGLHRPETDVSSLGQFLALRYIPAPATGFVGVLSLLPGHRAEVTSKGITTFCYWNVKYEPDMALGNIRAILPQVEELLIDSVRIRLMSDVAFGAYLSGGVDSSLIVALMTRILDRPVKAFSVGFRSQSGIDEIPYASEVAKHLGADHSWVECGPEDLSSSLGSMVWHCDLPMADPAAIPTYMVSRLAGPTVRMVLTGEGSDELFGGYPKYAAEKILRWVPTTLARAFSWPKAGGSRKAALLRQILAARSESERLMLWFANVRDATQRRDLVHPDARAAAQLEAPAASVAALLQQASAWDAFSRIAYVDFKTWLPDDLLLRADRMCMAWSVEGRVPFLDHRLVELLAKIPSGQKMSGLRRKPLLKEMAEKYLPKAIVHRKKVGFTVPLTEWLRGPLREFAFDMLTSRVAVERGLLNPVAVQKMLDSHCSEKEDYGREIWSLLVLEAWADTKWQEAPERAA